MGRRGEKRHVSPRLPSPSPFSLRFFVIRVLAATATKLTKLKPVGRGLLVFGRYVVAALALVTLQNNIIARHRSSSISDC
jgi:hypothetical protein